jgi:hypothetical protein
MEAIMRKISFAKVLLLIFMTLIVSLAGISKKKIIDSNWTDSPLKIDGFDKDWADGAFNFKKKVQADYAFKNDAEYLYVLFKFKDLKYLSSIQTTGMTMWFNTEGKDKKHYGLKFMRKEISVDEYIALLEQKQGKISEEEKNELYSNTSYFIADIKIINKKSKSPSQGSENADRKPAKYNVKVQDNGVIYEFKIPLDRKTDLAPGIGTEPGKIIKVRFEWGGITAEMRKAWIKNRASGAKTEVGPPSKIESESGRGGGTSASPSSSTQGTGSLTTLRMMNKKYSFWVDVRLALN